MRKKAPEHSHDFRRHLQDELLIRCERNPRYSLRAFARHLGLSHATLSHILAGRRPLTEKMIRRLGASLALSLKEIENFTTFHSVGPVEDGAKLPDTYVDLAEDVFASIAEWYYDAILELTHLEHFKPEAKWIAKMLSLSVLEVNVAVERLQRLGLLTIHADGRWEDTHRNSTTSLDHDFTTAALMRYQAKILQMSLDALQDVPKTKRQHVSNMVAVQKADIPEIRKIIDQFRWKLSKYIQRKESKPDEVYQLSVSFFPLTKSEGFGV